LGFFLHVVSSSSESESERGQPVVDSFLLSESDSFSCIAFVKSCVVQCSTAFFFLIWEGLLNNWTDFGEPKNVTCGIGVVLWFFYLLIVSWKICFEQYVTEIRRESYWNMCQYFRICILIGFVCDFIAFLCKFTIKTTEHTVASYESSNFAWKFPLIYLQKTLKLPLLSGFSKTKVYVVSLILSIVFKTAFGFIFAPLVCLKSIK
jgi:hypothetical protein